MTTNWQIGDRIQNRWQIYKILKGGMGIVYVVYDHEVPNAYAAKTFQDEIFALNPAIADRFTQEALTWVNLDSHQNVTEARFVQKIEGKPFLFLEYVSGGDLSDWIGTPRLTEDLPQVLRFAIGFCDGMSHALSKGITAHRDIKPANCLVAPDGTLKVTDFGLAKVFDDAGLADTEMPQVQGLSINLTRTGQGAGTPPYMAPEQFADAKHVDVRADIYSFGVLLYEMITGRLPFVGRSWEELKQLHQSQPAPPLGRGSAELRRIVRRCLAKKPASRYGEFGDVRYELAEIYKELTGEGVPQAAWGVALNEVQGNNKGVSLRELGRYEESLDYCDYALELNPHYELAWDNKALTLYVLRRYEEALACHDRAVEINPRYAGAWTNKGITLNALGQYEETLACYDRAIEINSLLAEPWSNKGGTLYVLGRYEEALACCDHALELNPRYELAWDNRGLALYGLERHEEAISCYERAVEINPRDAGAWTNKGIVLNGLGRDEEALDCYDRALNVNPRLPEPWINKGNSLHAAGRDKEALVCYDRALEISPRFAEAWSGKGISLDTLGQHEEAVADYDRALQINPRSGNVWQNKGLALFALGRHEEAIECSERALEINPRDEQALLDKGAALFETGRYEEALACFDRALEINPRDGYAWQNKGAALVKSGHLLEALDCFKEAHKLGFPHAAQAIAWCQQMLDR